MKSALQNPSHEELVKLLSQREAEIARYENTIAKQEARIFDLEFHNEQLRRLVYGASRERFISNTPVDQLPLPLYVDEEAIAATVVVATEKIAYERRTGKKKNHPGRNELPSHLPVEVTVIEPTEDVSAMKKIGEEVSDVLELTPASLFIKRTIRPKYASVSQEEDSTRIVIADAPRGPFEKCKAGTNLVITFIIDKFIYHLPIDRQLKRLSVLGADIAPSTVTSWLDLAAENLRPLYAVMRQLVVDAHYLQVDETGLAVQDRTKTGVTHKGYLWGYHVPPRKMVYFEYRRGRGQVHCHEMLSDFEGYLQTDDYQAYHGHKARDGVTGVACMAHARRKFEQALTTDHDRASAALSFIQQIYAVEREARDGGLSYEDRKELRLDKALPLLNDLGKWLANELQKTLPKSPIGIAIRYAVRLWDQLLAYLNDGQIEIDNNLMENAIRPIALGRKNWLFAGSHDAAENIAMYRSFFATCILNNINPQNWLRYVLDNINTTAPAKYYTLLPNFIDPELVR
jgi:transposase